MGFWEFLIQKEGDRSWLPLESPDVEILEGRYRVVARSNRVNTPVEIQIMHIAIAEEPPKRRTQKRSSQTNPDGLVVVIPFTRLQPGIWELSCTGDLMADFTGEGWHHAIKLQVLSHAMESTDEWEPDWQTEPSEPASSHAHTPTLLETPPPPVSPVPAPSPPSQTPPPAALPSEPSLELERLTVVPPVPLEPITTGPQEPDVSAVAPEAVALEAVTSEAVTLEVVALEAITPEDTSSDQSTPRIQITEEIAASEIFQMAARLSQEVVDAVFQDLEAAPVLESSAESTLKLVESPAIAPLTTPVSVSRSDSEIQEISEIEASEMPEVATSPAVTAAAAIANYPTVQINLTRDTYTARRGETLTLAGRIERCNADSTSGESAIGSTPVAIPKVGLRIRLHDPQTAQVLVDVGRSLPIQTVPSPFECTIAIPSGYQTRLLLGTMTLMAGATELATQSFSVTADLTELLEAVANAYPESDLVQPPLEFTTPATAADLDLTFLEFLQSPKPMVQFQTTNQQAIPPQLNLTKSARSPQRTAIASPISIGIGNPASAANSVPSSDSPHPSSTDAIDSGTDVIDSGTDAIDSGTDAINSGTDVINRVSSHPLPSEAAKGLTSSLTLADLVQDDEVSQEWQTTPPPASPRRPSPSNRVPSPADQAFRSLNLQHRFLSRLNALAGDTELSSSLHQHPIEALPINEAPLGLDTALTAHEVVVEDEPLAPAYARQPAPLEPPAAFILPADEPVPAPDLSIPYGELVSGRSIFITVKLPDVKSRIYVKLWVLDRQTRSLLDGPRWFMAFVPDGLGHLETRTQVTVPYGCLEVIFEAIAIEMMTKRESHKVAIERQIIPPDLPALPDEDLEI